MAAAIKTTIAKVDKPTRPYTILDFTGSTSYPALGEPVAPSDFGFTTLDHILPGIAISGAFILDVVYDPTNSSLRFYYPTGGATAAPAVAAAPVSAAPGTGTFVVTTTPDAGAVAVTGSAAKPALVGVITGALAPGAVTPGAGKEVPTTMDISGFKVRLLAFGV